MESVFQQLADEDILLLYLLDQHYLNPLDPKQTSTTAGGGPPRGCRQSSGIGKTDAGDE